MKPSLPFGKFFLAHEGVLSKFPKDSHFKFFPEKLLEAVSKEKIAPYPLSEPLPSLGSPSIIIGLNVMTIRTNTSNFHESVTYAFDPAWQLSFVSTHMLIASIGGSCFYDSLQFDPGGFF